MPEPHELVQEFLAKAVETSGLTLSGLAAKIGVAASTLTRSGPGNKHLLSLRTAYLVSRETGVPIPQVAPGKPALGEVLKRRDEVALLRFWRDRDEEERRTIIRLLHIDLDVDLVDRRVA